MIKWTVRILMVLILPFIIISAGLSVLAEMLFSKQTRQDFAEAWRNPEKTEPGIFLKKWGEKRRAALGEKE